MKARISSVILLSTLVVGTATALAIPPDPEFVIYRPSNTGIPGQSDVLWVRFGPDQRAWVSARDHFWLQGGVGILDVAEDTWTTYSNWQTPLPEWNYDIDWAADGSAWIAGGGALNHFDGTTWATYDAGNSPLVGDRNWGVSIGPNDHVWIANGDINEVQGGLFEFDGAIWTHHDEPFMRTYFGISSPINVFVTSSGAAWASFEFMSGMAYFDGAAWTHRPTAPALLELAEAPDGQLYGVNGYGTYRYSEQTGNWTQIGAQPSHVLTVDSWGNVWIGVPGEPLIGLPATVRKYDGAAWSTIAVTPSNVGSIDVRPDGHVWLSTKQQVRHYAPDGTGVRIYNSVNTGMPSYLMNRAYCDRDGIMWFTELETGASRFDGMHWRNFGAYNGGEDPHPFQLPSGELIAEGVTDVFQDTQRYIWAISNGVARSHADDLENWQLWYFGNSNLPSGTIDHIAEDANGTIWVGFYYGMYWFDGTTWNYHTFGPPGSTQNHVTGMATDPAGNMWVITYAGMLHKWNGQTWTSYFDTMILPRCIAAGPDGDIWIGATNGLYRFNGASFTRYTTANSGLIRNNISAVTVREDGLLAATCEDLSNPPYTGALVFLEGTEWSTFAWGQSALPFYQSLDLAFDADGHLWMMNVNNGGVKVLVGQIAVPGDIDGDGDVDMTDRDLFVGVLLGSNLDPLHADRSDLNGDGAANGGDAQMLVNLLLGP